MNIDEFKEKYPNASWLESMNGCERWSNGEDENSEDESVWFDEDGERCESPDLDF